MGNVIIGLDLGGTHLRIGAVGGDYKVYSFCKLKSEGLARAKNPMKALKLLIEGYIKDHDIAEVTAISIGVPSSVMNDKQTVICTTNIQNGQGDPVFRNRNMANEIEAYTDMPTYVNNDTNNLLLYDVMAHNLDKEAIIMGIYIGTGVGAAVLVHGHMLNGKDGAALDIGHMPYFQGDAKCSCGKDGCCECYASGWKLQDIRKVYFPDTMIDDMFLQHANEKPLQDFVQSCAHVFAVMATIFNPEVIVVGGGVPDMKGFPRAQFEQAVNAATGKDVMNYGFRYVYSEDVESKGVVGAALFAERQMQKSQGFD